MTGAVWPAEITKGQPWMTRRLFPAAATALAVAALLSAGCSAGSTDAGATDPHAGVHKNPGSAIDPQAGVDVAGGAPGAYTGENEDAAPTSWPSTPGTDITSLQITGHRARIDVLTLPRTPAVKNPRLEAPRAHAVKEVEGATTAPAQTEPSPASGPSLTVNAPGLDYAHWGAGHPPDTSGAVGPNQYVQTVNTSIGIYSKSGNQLNAFTYNTFFSRFHSGTPCDNQNGGDPQVIFDRPSNRWIIGDLSYPGPYYFCMAVSDGPDITDLNWTLYPFKASDNELNDYPKIASGPNGLFLTSNMFLNFSQFTGAQVWAFERSSLGTTSLNSQTVRTSSQYGSLLPANSYAATESKGPDYLVSLETTTRLGLWKYKVNWKNPSRSTFTQTPTLIPVDTFQPAGNVAEKGGSPLDALSDRPMYQLQLSQGTLWFNHSVQAGSQAGVRWYQIGNLTGTPRVMQQSTFAPSDGLSRWMGSLAVDKNGNMAVGYSTSSPNDYPSINFATRKSSDPKNQLTSEARIVKGTGAQTGLSRWGDYSQMSLDPDNRCTFWYTTEYYKVTGGDWQTRIASFTFPNCS